MCSRSSGGIPVPVSVTMISTVEARSTFFRVFFTSWALTVTLPAGGGMFQGIHQEIGEYLGQPILITGYMR